MPRRPRDEVEGGIYHVFARGNGQQEIFVDDDDRRLYLRLLGKVVVKQRWLCLAYCLMDNHVHLLATPLSTSKIALAVTGGTGAYAGARGEVIAREGAGTATDVFRLMR
jgi:REP element-mobilizing transposase RayT